MSLENMPAKEIDSIAEEKAKIFKSDGLKTNQIRNFYSAITRIRKDFTDNKKIITPEIERTLVMLKPKLAYAAGRQKAVRDHFYKFMKDNIDDVLSANNKSTTLENFFALTEAIVAYHKFHGGE